MRPTPEQPFRRFDLSTGNVVPNQTTDIAISPDGRVLAMVGLAGSEQAIYLRHLDGDAEFRKLAGTETGYTPAFSPDGQWIVFRTGNRALVKMSVNGGGAVTLVAAGKLDPYFPQWATPDEIIFTTPSSVYRVAASGGEPELLPKVTAGRIAPLPDGSGILHSTGDVLLYDFKSDSSVVLVRGGVAPMYLPSGHLVYVGSEGGLFAVRFNLAKRVAEGEPARVLERVGSGAISRGYAISSNGVLMQRDADGAGNSVENRLIIVDPGKGADTLRLPTGNRRVVRFSPNGRFIAMEVLVPSRGNETDLYTLDLITGTYTQLSFAGDYDEPAWSPDGTQLLFDVKDSVVSQREDLHIKPADNSAPARLLPMGNAGELGAAQWLSDTLILFEAEMPGRGRDIFTASPMRLNRACHRTGSSLRFDRTSLGVNRFGYAISRCHKGNGMSLAGTGRHRAGPPMAVTSTSGAVPSPWIPSSACALIGRRRLSCRHRSWCSR
jgi:dipeptidyl aminopeptidase/acylaminoacyl peptidase